MKKIEIEKTLDNIVKYCEDPNVIFCELYRFKDRTGNEAYRIGVKTARAMKMSEILEFINNKNTFILKIEEESN